LASYDYKAGKKRIEEILDNNLEVIENNKIPKDENFTFSNAYLGWVTGIFVDIRDSTSLFNKDSKAEISKIVRSFTSEIIEILRKDDELLREIGIRGDCVYAIYTTPTKDSVYEVVDRAVYSNTFLKMLNKQLNNYNLSNINIGIGISTAQELVVKTGRKKTGINNSVWIGDAVTKASNLSSLANKNGYESILISSTTYSNMIETMEANNPNKNVKSWFSDYSTDENGFYYGADIVKSVFNDWINEGMID
jgi:class 3 adenylate cyclase